MPAAWAVAATLDTPEGRLAIGTGLEPARSEGSLPRRVVRIDGRPAPSQTALGLHVAAVWLTPQLDRLFLDGAERAPALPRPAGDGAASRACRRRGGLRECAAPARPAAGRGQSRPALVHRAGRHHGPPRRGPGRRPRRHRPAPRCRGAAGRRSVPARLARHGRRDRRLARRDGGARRRGPAARARWPPAACATPRPAPHPWGRIAAISRCAISISTCRRPRARRASRRPCWSRSRWRMPGWWRCRAAAPPLLLLDEIAAHLDRSAARRCSTEVVALGVAELDDRHRCRTFQAARRPRAGAARGRRR